MIRDSERERERERGWIEIRVKNMEMMKERDRKNLHSKKRRFFFGSYGCVSSLSNNVKMLYVIKVVSS